MSRVVCWTVGETVKDDIVGDMGGGGDCDGDEEGCELCALMGNGRVLRSWRACVRSAREMWCEELSVCRSCWRCCFQRATFPRCVANARSVCTSRLRYALVEPGMWRVPVVTRSSSKRVACGPMDPYVLWMRGRKVEPTCSQLLEYLESFCCSRCFIRSTLSDRR